MNIRTVSNPIIPIENLKTAETRDVKLDVSSEDRDANGKRENQEENKEPLTEDEMKKVKEYLETLTGLKANGLTFEIEDSSSDLRTFLIKDHNGVVVRRIIEWEMRPLVSDKDKKTGQIFDKAA